MRDKQVIRSSRQWEPLGRPRLAHAVQFTIDDARHSRLVYRRVGLCQQRSESCYEYWSLLWQFPSLETAY